MDRTISIVAERSASHPPRGFLTIALLANRPRQLPVRIDLGAVDRVELGRGAAQRVRADGPRRLRVDLDDPTMSKAHVVLERVDDRWTAIDQGSKNGTLVDGARAARTELASGAVLTMGAVFAVFRVAAVAPGPLTVDGQALPADPIGLRTVHPGLDQELGALRHAATSAMPVLVLGETGTGKELIARAVHHLSARSGRFVAVNCGAIPEALIASELFGVRRGAFSGATADRSGLFRAADGGTLLLDEIGEMPEAAQVSLLRVLQEQQVVPVGDTVPVSIDVRVIAATHRDLRLLAHLKTFRDDLLGRLAGVIVQLPPLRDRREDLAFMVARALDDSAAPADLTFSAEAAHLMFTRPWRRNVRELQQVVAAAVAAGVTRIERAHLVRLGDDLTPPPAADEAAPVVPLLVDRGALDRPTLEALLAAHNGNLSAVARALTTSRTQVTRLMQRFGLSRGSRDG